MPIVQWASLFYTFNMNNRDYKMSGVGSYFHIYNRGNAKENIFINEEDYRFFLLRLKQNLFPEENNNPRIKSLPPNSFSLISYCLMPNHFHLLMRQNSDIPLGRFILKLSTSYSKFLNKKYGRVGHVFQDQFKQAYIDDDKYLVWVTAYIHQNPKTAKLVGNSTDYKWSSLQNYLGNDSYVKCEKDVILEQYKSKIDFLKDTNEIGKIISKNKVEYLLLDI